MGEKRYFTKRRLEYSYEDVLFEPVSDYVDKFKNLTQEILKFVDSRLDISEDSKIQEFDIAEYDDYLSLFLVAEVDVTFIYVGEIDEFGSLNMVNEDCLSDPMPSEEQFDELCTKCGLERKQFDSYHYYIKEDDLDFMHELTEEDFT